MSAPVTTKGAAGNALASQTLAAGANVSLTLDWSVKIGGWLQLQCTPGGTVAAAAGTQIDVYARAGSSPAADTAALTSLVMPSVASTAGRRSLWLDTGQYSVRLTNLDAANATTVLATADTVDGVA